MTCLEGGSICSLVKGGIKNKQVAVGPGGAALSTQELFCSGSPGLWRGAHWLHWCALAKVKAEGPGGDSQAT